jgi:putative PIN family toxin of toxin-antitoxin system
VLDTSVLITALRSGTGAAAEVIRLVLIEQVQCLMDYKLSCEYREVALREEHVSASGRTIERIRQTIDDIESKAVPVLVNLRFRPLSSDPQDDLVLDVGINGQADAIVTNNVKHFEAAARNFGIPVYTPREILTKLREGGHPHAR